MAALFSIERTTRDALFSGMLNSLVVQLYRHRVRGRDRLWQSAKDHLGGHLCARNKFGVRLALDPHDYVDGFVLTEGFYESEVFDAIRDAMRPGDTFWDVGANAGHHAITLAATMPLAKVVAFEPSPREVARIVRSIGVARVASFEILPLALSDETALTSFYVCRGNAGRNSLDAWGGESGYELTLAQCVRADDIVARGYAIPAVVKIDVEGAELRVLRGMKSILATGQCRRIVFEAGRGVLTPHDEIHDILSGAGFTIRELERREKTAHNLENFVADRA